jgi:hypothetical protein
MSELTIKDGAAATKYLGTMGVGTTGDPYFSIPADFYTEVAKGNVPGHTLVHKFGHNSATPTTLTPICSIGDYITLQPASATTLRIKAGGDANDTAAGSGAREVTLQGLDETGTLVSESIATAGASASAVTTTTFIRLFRIKVTASGTYATSTTASHTAAITIENGAGGTDWGTIDLNGFALSQSTIGAYSVPLGKTAYLISYDINAETTKIVDAVFFQRQSILDAAAPYEAMRIVFEIVGLTDTRSKVLNAPIAFPALTDIGFMAKVSTGTANVSVNFDILLVDD